MRELLRFSRSVSVVFFVACTPPAEAPVCEPLSPSREPVVADLAAVGMSPGLHAALDSILGAAVADSAAPGAVVAVGRYGRLVHLRGYGRTD